VGGEQQIRRQKIHRIAQQAEARIQTRDRQAERAAGGFPERLDVGGAYTQAEEELCEESQAGADVVRPFLVVDFETRKHARRLHDMAGEGVVVHMVADGEQAPHDQGSNLIPDLQKKYGAA